MSVFETVPLWRSSSYVFHSPPSQPQPQPPPVIGSALTLLNQSGIFNCACCWLSVHQLTPHARSRRHSRTGNTLTGTLMEYYCFLLLWICCQHMGECKVLTSSVVLRCVCVSASVHVWLSACLQMRLLTLVDLYSALQWRTPSIIVSSTFTHRKSHRKLRDGCFSAFISRCFC